MTPNIQVRQQNNSAYPLLKLCHSLNKLAISHLVNTWIRHCHTRHNDETLTACSLQHAPTIKSHSDVFLKNGIVQHSYVCKTPGFWHCKVGQVRQQLSFSLPLWEGCHADKSFINQLPIRWIVMTERLTLHGSDTCSRHQIVISDLGLMASVFSARVHWRAI